jgi:hypothetical protein
MDERRQNLHVWWNYWLKFLSIAISYGIDNLLREQGVVSSNLATPTI